MKRKMSKTDRITFYALLGVCAVIMISALAAGALRQNEQSEGGNIAVIPPAATPDAGSALGLEDIVGSDNREAESAPPQAAAEVGNEQSGELVEEPSQVEEAMASAAAEIDLRAPVDSSEITMGYSHNCAAVYSKTFNEYRSDHAGVDFAASVGDSVYAAADGEVLRVYDDERLGVSVVIRHSDSFSTQYSNLDEAVSVEVGERISAGEVIGFVGSSAPYELADESHVHFAVMVDGQYIDAEEYL